MCALNPKINIPRGHSAGSSSPNTPPPLSSGGPSLLSGSSPTGAKFCEHYIHKIVYAA